MNLQDISGIGEKTLAVLSRAEITTPRSLLNHYPRAYRTYHATSSRSARPGDWVSLVGTISRPVSKRGARVTTQLATFKDSAGSLTLRWFNSPFIVRSVVPERRYLMRGQLTIFGNTRQIVAPQLKVVEEEYLATDELMSIYPSIGALKSGVLRNIIVNTLNVVPPIADPLSEEIRDQNNLIDLDSAIRIIHRPSNNAELETAIRRLAFDELYDLQLECLEQSELSKVKTNPLHWNTGVLENWITNLPFTPTTAQNKVIAEITSDLGKNIAMRRLLAGEVGSGKTLVAAAAALATHSAGMFTLVMAPTQILAEQLHASFTKLLGNQLTVSLITAAQRGDPTADVVIGTQALLSPKHRFNNIGLVIIDEQHRFGVKQREYLSSLSPAPHMLTMTATPIPRTLAMTIFSNMAISRLDELPKDRLRVKTYLVEEVKRASAYAWIKKEIETNNNRAFVVVPLIDEGEDDEGNAKKSLKLLESDLKKRFASLKVDIMHGRMKEKEKTEHLQAFRDGVTHILVATSMIEVGIDIPEANIMVIEDAERFGLATLHQLRGRVGRGGGQGYCLLFSDRGSENAKKRLNYFVSETNGEKLASFDLEMRGPGQLYGESQHGFFSLRFASLADTALLQSTHDAAVLSLKKT